MLRVLKKVDVNRKSPSDGLTALHFAIEWPWGLRHLVEENADVDVVDNSGRRPIHLAIATGQSESALLLLQADCALESPTASLLQLALQLKDPEQRDAIVPAVIDALVDRHRRLLQLGRGALPEIMLSTLGISEFKSCRKAPEIIDALRKSGVSVPKALALDDTNVYETAERHGEIRLSPRYADRLWSAGFYEIDRPNDDGPTPIPQSWYVADFDMVTWYMQKGVSARSRNQGTASCGLHLYAAQMVLPGSYFRFSADLVNTDFAVISDIQRDETLHHDECFCICAPQGCTPASILVKQLWPMWGRKDLDTLFRTWCEKTNPEADLLELSAREYTRAWLYRISEYPHTCCDLGRDWRWPERAVMNDEASAGVERVIGGWMRHYARVREGYEGPLEDFPRVFMSEVRDGSLASESDFEELRSGSYWKRWMSS